jgi:dihydrolipoamide dehydrogenase
VKQKAKIIIIGLGSAGLSALTEVSKVTDDFLLIQHGPYGTSCARTACMPTKTLLEVAGAYHRRRIMASRGVSATEKLKMDTTAALRYVRDLRDEFVKGMVEETNRYSSRIIHGKAVFLEPTVLRVDDILVTGEQIIIATGSRPIFPEVWKQFSDLILTTDDMIEQQDFPRRMAVIGLGPAGLEYAQALSRLGIEVTGFEATSTVAGISDPEVNAVAIETLQQEFTIVLDRKVEMTRRQDSLFLQAGKVNRQVDKVLLAIGRQPNVDALGLEKIGIPTNESGVPLFSRQTMQVENFPLYIAGDANGDIPILHEAVDEGHIAGFNATRSTAHCFKRRVPLTIIFTEPSIAAIGKTYSKLPEENFAIGHYDFSKQSRARMSGSNKGLLRIYAAKEKGIVLGAEMIAPSGEHLAHFLALAIDRQMTVFDLLTLPFYHPTVEEGMRTAIREAAKKVSCSLGEAELLLCRSMPLDLLC